MSLTLAIGNSSRLAPASKATCKRLPICLDSGCCPAFSVDPAYRRVNSSVLDQPNVKANASTTERGTRAVETSTQGAEFKNPHLR